MWSHPYDSHRINLPRRANSAHLSARPDAESAYSFKTLSAPLKIFATSGRITSTGSGS
jgi:hypothetical protein